MKLKSLDVTISKDEVEQFILHHKPRTSVLNRQNVTSAIYLFIVLIVLIVITPILSTSVAVFFVMMVLLITVIIIGIVAYFQERKKLYGEFELALRLEKLARDNGWNYGYKVHEKLHNVATLFNRGRNHVYTNVLTAPNFQVGLCSFEIESGLVSITKNFKLFRNRQELSHGYMVMPLERALPHMLLDSKSNNLKFFGFETSNMPASFKRDQVVSLEGDFDKYYTLYAPADYGVDVRYVFTPDLMSFLIEESDSTDIEIVDNNMFVYFGKFNIESVAFWHRVDRLTTVIGEKLVGRAGRYDDDRTVDGSVAKQGVRLRKGLPIVTIIVVIVWIVLKFLGSTG